MACVVTDIRMPSIDGIELIKRLREDRHGFPIIVMTGHGDVPLAVEAMKAGAFGFLREALRRRDDGLQDQSAIEQGISAKETDRRARELAERISSLTPRERQVLEGLIKGQPNKVIGPELSISPRTVEIYRANVMEKVQATSVSELGASRSSSCGAVMRIVRVVPKLGGLPELPTFRCLNCGEVLTREHEQ